MVCEGSVHHRCRGSGGGLEFICIAGVLQPEGRPLTLDSRVPPGIGRHSAPATVHDFILGKYLFPSG